MTPRLPGIALLGYLAVLSVGLAAPLAQAAGTSPDRPVRADPATPAPPGVEEVIVSSPEPRYVAPTTRDRIGRIWAPVLLNGQGPYRLVLDTGASRSAITQRVVDDIGTGCAA